jgi:hypothetical protein
MTTDLVWRLSHGVFGDWARPIWWQVLDDLAQPLNDIIIIDFKAGFRDVSSLPVYWYPRVSQAINGCTLLFMKLKAMRSARSPASCRALIFFSS